MRFTKEARGRNRMYRVAEEDALAETAEKSLGSVAGLVSKGVSA